MTDDRGNIKFQQDHALPLKTSQWNAGNVIAEKYDVTVPENIGEGTYLIRFGLYDPSTGERMQLERSWYRDNAAYLGKISVRKALSLTIMPATAMYVSSIQYRTPRVVPRTFQYKIR